MNLSTDLAATCERLALERPGGSVTSAAPARPAEPADEFKDESAFQAAVIKEAKKLSWLIFHPWLSIKSKAGWVDLAMARGNRLILAELKTETGKLSAAQENWKERLETIGGNVTYAVWQPHDWATIMATLA